MRWSIFVGRRDGEDARLLPLTHCLTRPARRFAEGPRPLTSAVRWAQSAKLLQQWVGHLAHLQPIQELQRPVGCNSDLYKFMPQNQPGPPHRFGSAGWIVLPS